MLGIFSSFVKNIAVNHYSLQVNVIATSSEKKIVWGDSQDTRSIGLWTCISRRTHHNQFQSGNHKNERRRKVFFFLENPFLTILFGAENLDDRLHNAMCVLCTYTLTNTQTTQYIALTSIIILFYISCPCIFCCVIC